MTTRPRRPDRTLPLVLVALGLLILVANLADAGWLRPDALLGLVQFWPLALVAAGYAPIPGIAAAPVALTDGGPALRTVLASADALHADQAAVLAGIVEPSGVPIVDAAASPSPRLAAAAATGSGRVQAGPPTARGRTGRRGA